MKDNIFVDISDGSTCEMLQVVIPKLINPDKLSYGSSINAEGELSLGFSSKIELRATNVHVIGSCNVMEDKYPFLPRKKYDQEYIRQYLHLRPRTRNFSSLLRLRDLATSIISEHLRNRGFINIHTPVLTSNDCEGAGEVFSVRPHSKEILKSMRKEGQLEDEIYFDTVTYLAVSGQLHLETVAR